MATEQTRELTQMCIRKETHSKKLYGTV